jgi:CubicO group peptidase (beta-lactamase class C family)
MTSGQQPEGTGASVPESGAPSWKIGALLEAAVSSGELPGAVAAAGRGPEILGQWVTGSADTTPGAQRPMTAGTVFDIASLTKVVGTTTTVLALAAAGALGLDDPVAGHLPAFTAFREGSVTIRHLLTHTSGLPAMAEFYRSCHSREELVEALFRTPLQVPPGSEVIYSDLGFMTLGEVTRAVTGAPLDDSVRRLVTGPLGLDSTRFTPLAGPCAVPPGCIAATERRDGDGLPWVGTVHDENARAAGGVSGHAGLFSVLADLARFAQWWVSDDDRAVPAALRRVAEADQTTGLAGRRGLGWVRIGDRFDILGPDWPPTAVSHTGFTGTSLALDPASGVWVVLLTNAVHFGRDHSAIKALRRDVHAAVASALLR